jgi:hypothetical protein
MNDDHGDQFPGAVAPAAPSSSSAQRADGTQQRLVRMRAAYTEKINSAVQADRMDLAQELAERTFVDELAGHPAGRRPVTRTPGLRPPGQAPTRLARIGQVTRRSLHRLDRYTVDVFNPGHPYRSDVERADHSA